MNPLQSWQSHMPDTPASFHPIMDQCSFGSGVQTLPCRGCKHEKEDKNVCITYKDCPGHIPTLMMPGESSQFRYEPTGKRRSHRTCQFPGCDNPLISSNPKTKYCKKDGHSSLVGNRMRRYPDNPELWLKPKMAIGGSRRLTGEKRDYRDNR